MHWLTRAFAMCFALMTLVGAHWGPMGTTVPLHQHPVLSDAALTSTVTLTPFSSAKLALTTPTGPAGVSLSWDTGETSLPRAISRPAVASGRNGRIYVFGGTAGGIEYRTTSIYDPTTNTWRGGRDMPTAREGAHAVGLPDGRIAVLGGATGCNRPNCVGATVYNKVEVYNPTADVWTTLPSMHTPRYRLGAALVGDKLYALGGVNQTGATASVEVLNLSVTSKSTWEPGPTLPQPINAAAVVADGSGRILVAGGAGNDGNLHTFYTLTSNIWVAGPGLPVAVAETAGTIGPDGKLYVTGGYYRTWLPIVQVYDPKHNNWSSVTPLPSPTCCMGSATVNGRIYVIGGAGGLPTAQVAIGVLTRKRRA